MSVSGPFRPGKLGSRWNPEPAGRETTGQQDQTAATLRTTRMRQANEIFQESQQKRTFQSYHIPPGESRTKKTIKLPL